MSQPYVGEIRLFGFNFAPVGWAACNGQLLAITQNETLFNLIGTTFGGDGINTFALPDLRGRVPMSLGSGVGLTARNVVGEQGGLETVTLVTSQLPAHTHAIDATGVKGAIACSSGPGNSRSPVGAVPAAEAAGVTQPYSSQPADTAMGASAVPAASAST